MSTEEQAVPFGNYQYEIYLKGLGGETPALPIDYDDLEALAPSGWRPRRSTTRPAAPARAAA